MLSTEQTEKRRFHRIVHDVPATVSDGERELPARTLDLSLKGCLLELQTGELLEMDRDCRIDLRLSDPVHIVMQAAPVHRHDTRIGFACRHIDVDSITALRRLVELNLANPDLLEEDLEALAHNPPA